MAGSNVTGSAGESAAARHLVGQGYKIRAANYRSRYGEIDIIAEKGQYIAFIEVKTRRSGAFARPMEHVTRAKLEKIRSTALLWLAANECPLQPRFDVIEVFMPRGPGHKPERIEHLENVL